MGRSDYGLPGLLSDLPRFTLAKVALSPGPAKFNSRRNIPSFKEGQPRRSKNATLPQRHRRGVGRFYERGCQEKDIPTGRPKRQVLVVVTASPLAVESNSVFQLDGMIHRSLLTFGRLRN